MKGTIIATIFIILGFASLSYAQKSLIITEDCVYLDELTAPTIPHTKVTCGFAPGETKNFPKEIIENYLRRSGIEAKVVNDVTVTRQGEKLSSDAIVAAAEKAYKNAYPDLEIKIEQVRFSRDIYAELEKDFSINIDTTKFGMTYAEIHNGIRKTSVYMYVRAFKEGFVAVERIRPGETVSDKVRPEMIDITTSRLSLVTDPTSTVATKIISKGKTLSKDLITEKPALLKGETVQLIYDNGIIRIETTGIIEENAFIGKPVTVRNTASQKVISANYMGNGIAKAAF